MCVFEKDLKIRYWEIDSSNRLTTKGFLKYLQDIANDHAEAIGYGFENISSTNLSWVLLNWKVQILRRPLISEVLHIKTWARMISKASSYRDFEIYDSNNNIICKASSKWALTNYTTHALERISPEMRDAYGILDKSVFEINIDEKMQEPENSSLTFEYDIQRRDIDLNSHVNNLCYLDFAYEALPLDVYSSLDTSTIEIIYKRQLRYPNKIKCFYSNSDGKHIVTIKSDDLATTHAIISIY